MEILFTIIHLYIADVSIDDIASLKGDSETKRLQFFYNDEVPENLMDTDLIKAYVNYINKRKI